MRPAGFSSRASASTEKVVISVVDPMDPWETPEQYRRRIDEEFAARLANPSFIPTRSAPQRGFYAGAGSLIAMGAEIARRLVRSRPTPADVG